MTSKSSKFTHRAARRDRYEMKWFIEHKLTTLILAILLALGIIFGISVARGGDGTSVSDALNTGMNAVSGGLGSVTHKIKSNITGIFSYKKLQAQVDELQEENNSLQRQLAEAKLEKDQLRELEELSQVLNYEYTKKEFKIVSADVTSLDGANWTNLMTINVGTGDGVEVGDAVINGMGLIGKVQDVGRHWAKVTSIIDDDSKISFKLARDSKQLGVVEGNSMGEVNGYMLDGESLVSQGDTLITSGLGTYPEGLEIGTVQDVSYNSNTMLKEISVETAADFKSIEKVSVII